MEIKISQLVVVILIVVTACASNPFTGKSTMAFVSNDQLFRSSFVQYNQILSEHKIIKGTKDAAMITRVGERLATAAERWLKSNGYPDYLEGYKWEYTLIDSPQINAWCMPGGKIAFYTGILPIAQNETAIAVIMGHEVAHALANHGQQRMSSGMLQQAGGVVVAVAAGGQSTTNQERWMQAYGLASTVGGILPFSRAHETEADEIGLKLMAIAGYNPDEAPALWQRMTGNQADQSPQQFLSTHPDNNSRITNLKARAPEAKILAKKYGITAFDPVN